MKKRWLAMTLAAAMTVSAAVPVFAEEAPIATEETARYAEEMQVGIPTEETAQVVEEPAEQYADDAQTGSEGNLTYKVNKDGKTCTITDCSTSASEELVIPGTINGYQVTSIGRGAFWNCSSLTSVTIPDSVTSIGGYAFYFCSSLTSVTIPGSVTSIGVCAFSNCSGLTQINVAEKNAQYAAVDGVLFTKDKTTLICYPGGKIGEYIVPSSVKTIGDYAFYECRSLTSVTIPDSVTSIGTYAFSSCSSLTSVTIPDSVTSIGEWAFSFCSSLTSITIPGSVTSIGGYAFYDCSSLTSVTIPDSVTSIGYCAFYGSGLTSVTIPKSVDTIGSSAFSDCTSLTDVYFPRTRAEWDLGYGAENAVIHCSDGDIVHGEYTIPETNITLQYSNNGSEIAIVGCNSDAAGVLEIPEKIAGLPVMELYDYSFLDCNNLTSITVPEGVKSIGNGMFSRCDALTEVKLPASVKNWGNYLFSSSNALKDVYYAGTAAQWIELTEHFSISDCTIHCADGIVAYDKYPVSDSNAVLDYCSDGKTVVVLKCNSSAEGTLKIPSAIDGAAVVKIGDSAFWYCSKLTSVTIPDSVTSLGNHILVECRGIQELTIGNGATAIPDNITPWCTGLKKVTLGKNAYFVSSDPERYTEPQNPFYNSTALEEISVSAQNPYLSSKDGVLYDKTTKKLIAYPAAKTAQKFETPSTVTTIAYGAFANSANLKSITLPNGVKQIDTDAFRFTKQLTEITLPQSVANVDHTALGDGQSLKSVTVLNPRVSLADDAIGVGWNPDNYDRSDLVPDLSLTIKGYKGSTAQTYAKGYGFKFEVLPDPAPTIKTTPMYRLYNPNSGEHFYTGSIEERDNLSGLGWNYEGEAWNAPTNTGTPVYRMFNPNSGDHHYTMSQQEVENLKAIGWRYEGVCWNSGGNVPQFRLYNPNADCGSHHYTSSEEERDNLVALGWNWEGIGWFGSEQ